MNRGLALQRRLKSDCETVLVSCSCLCAVFVEVSQHVLGVQNIHFQQVFWPITLIFQFPQMTFKLARSGDLTGSENGADNEI